MKHHYLILLSSLALIGLSWAEAPAPSDAKVDLRAPAATFSAPPSAQPAAQEPAPAPSVLPPAPPKPTDLLANASTKARADLDAALKELTATREKISSEKLPLSKKLSLAEDDLALARKELDLAQRARDMKNLDQSSLKVEIKQREEENTYMLNLLNEFGRNFGEKSIHISERAGHREKLDLAKATHENSNASHEDKYKASFRIVDAALTRIGDLLGGHSYPGVALDAQGGLVEGKFAQIGPMVLFSSADGSVAGWASEAKGSKETVLKGAEHSKIFGPAFASLMAGGESVIASDFTMGQALRNYGNKNSIIRTFIHGGPIMWPLLFAAIVAAVVSLERSLFIVSEKRRQNPAQVEQIFTLVENGDRAGAIRVAQSSTDFIARVLGFALSNAELSISHAISKASAIELKRFSRGLPILDTIITAAPLLGLLGTVTGMMNTFSMMGGDELGAPAAITGGIAEGLIATAFGLLVAITCLFPNNYLNARIESAQHEMEDAGRRLELMLMAEKAFERASHSHGGDHGNPPPAPPSTKAPPPTPSPSPSTPPPTPKPSLSTSTPPRTATPAPSPSLSTPPAPPMPSSSPSTAATRLPVAPPSSVVSPAKPAPSLPALSPTTTRLQAKPAIPANKLAVGKIGIKLLSLFKPKSSGSSTGKA
jgi:biopolymer transport protein ExbB